jgi:hypothetical protein
MQTTNKYNHQRLWFNQHNVLREAQNLEQLIMYFISQFTEAETFY